MITAFISPGYLGSLGTPLAASRDLAWADIYNKIPALKPLPRRVSGNAIRSCRRAHHKGSLSWGGLYSVFLTIVTTPA
jgi:hypothetical protein